MRERTAGEPQAGLRRADPHVAQFLAVGIEAPDRPDAAGDVGAEQRTDDVILSLVSGRQHHQVGLQRRAVGQLQSIADELPDVIRLDQPDRSVRDQLGTADIEIIAAAAGAEFQRPAGAVFAELQPEAGLLQPLTTAARPVSRTSLVISLCDALMTASGTEAFSRSRISTGGPSPR